MASNIRATVAVELAADNMQEAGERLGELVECLLANELGTVTNATFYRPAPPGNEDR